MPGLAVCARAAEALAPDSISTSMCSATPWPSMAQTSLARRESGALFGLAPMRSRTLSPTTLAMGLTAYLMSAAKTARARARRARKHRRASGSRTRWQ
eukprot:145118-Pyramimonas_sp.AAC.1